MPSTTRKGFLAGAAAIAVTPTIATAAPIRRRALGRAQTETLVAWCDLLVPGARRSDAGGFVNAQLGKPPEQALLMLRFLDWPPPYDAFYRQGLTALDAASERTFDAPFARLTARRQGQMLGRVLGGKLTWKGPPPPLFYFVTRADGVDVVYGSTGGHRQVAPPAKW